MRKYVILTLLCLTITLLCACSNTAQKAIEQGKLSIASGDYQTALNSLELAKNEGARGDSLDDMISIIKNYVEAKEAYDEDNIDGANEALNKITQDYSEYAIKNDIEKLKSDIAAKQSTMGDVDMQIAGTKKLLASGDYVSVKANISELYTKNLTEYQKNQVDELNETLVSAQSKIDAASQTEPDVVYVEKPQSQTTSTGNTQVVDTYYVVNCKQSITLRTSPSTSAGEITQIPLGQAVGYIENAGNGFYKINYDGVIGYSLASYLSPVKESTSKTYNSSTTVAKVVNANEYITLRSSPSTSASEITKIPAGAYVTYLGVSSNGFYKIQYNGMIGYGLQSYLQIQ